MSTTLMPDALASVPTAAPAGTRHLFTSESVTEGHPDKIADQISDAVLDAILHLDPAGRVACETLVTTGLAVIAGEITTHAWVDLPKLVRDTIQRIGYDDATYGFDSKTCAVMSTIDKQSADIAQGVDTGGAGDQGMMFGYATDETAELMPLPILLSHRLTQRLSELRKNGTLPWLRPDGKAQVSVAYDGDRPVSVETVVVSTQHAEEISADDLRAAIIEHVIEPVIPEALRSPEDHVPHQSDRPLRRRRAAGRRGPHGPQDHRRHVRRHGAARRRRVQRQGSVEGRPVGGVRGALGGEERRRGQARAALRGAARLRDRCRASRSRSW